MNSIMRKEILETPGILQNTVKNAEAPVGEIADEMYANGLKRIFLACRGSSANAGLYFRYLCEILTGITVIEISPSVFTIYGGEELKYDMSGGFLLAISQGGKGVDIRMVTEKAKEKAVLTAALTNFPDSPLAETCDTVLPLSLGLEESMAATKSFTSELLVLNMLACRLAGKEDGSQKLIDAFAAALKKEEQIRCCAEKYRNAGTVYVIGRGKTLSLAKEMCCKLQETCLVNAFPFSAADFMHGPFALVEQGTRAILFHSRFAATESTREMYDSLKGQKAEVTVITDDPDFPGKADSLISVESGSEDESVFAMTAVLQLFAADLADVRGTNPDTSRNLNKYTETI